MLNPKLDGWDWLDYFKDIVTTIRQMKARAGISLKKVAAVYISPSDGRVLAFLLDDHNRGLVENIGHVEVILVVGKFLEEE